MKLSEDDLFSLCFCPTSKLDLPKGWKLHNNDDSAKLSYYDFVFWSVVRSYDDPRYREWYTCCYNTDNQDMRILIDTILKDIISHLEYLANFEKAQTQIKEFQKQAEEALKRKSLEKLALSQGR
jgi:hypothetical protein